MSSEDLKSLIVTDPDIVDEELDVSGLRTQTDTNPCLHRKLQPGIYMTLQDLIIYQILISYLLMVYLW